jgi:hypothetical protein
MDQIDQMGGAHITYALNGYNSSNRIIIKQSGTATIQNGCYIVNADGLAIYCDGENMWIHNETSAEVVITHDEGLPFLKAANITKDSSGKIIGRYHTDEGIDYIVEISSIKPIGQKLDKSNFTLDINRLDDSVIITDLRE